MRRFGFGFIFALIAGVALASSGCNWTETRQEFPPNAFPSDQHHHDHSDSQ